MAQINIPNRPFASDLFTGLMIPDGLFVTMFGKQNINIHLTNSGAAAHPSSEVYIESTSHPGILVTPKTHQIGSLVGDASRGWKMRGTSRDTP